VRVLTISVSATLVVRQRQPEFAAYARLGDLASTLMDLIRTDYDLVGI
jgi:hypothetical protein